MEQGNNAGERASLVERAIERLVEPSAAPAPSAVQAIEARDEDPVDGLSPRQVPCPLPRSLAQLRVPTLHSAPPSALSLVPLTRSVLWDYYLAP